MLDLLTLLTYPTQLPFYPQLQQSSNPAIKAFIKVANGMGGLTMDQASQVLGFFLRVPQARCLLK
ncbi:hypothetical protein [Paraflavitalea speifideaquila]|uniref:hypothetical protein n=1 Tax=Paraflavitalea speifideaquila TaxID=3076558 RepID=UPI0028E43182|nr:hypothetical protein [Paraflavitalea speifideiaquila]